MRFRSSGLFEGLAFFNLERPSFFPFFPFFPLTVFNGFNPARPDTETIDAGLRLSASSGLLLATFLPQMVRIRLAAFLFGVFVFAAMFRFIALFRHHNRNGLLAILDLLAFLRAGMELSVLELAHHST